MSHMVPPTKAECPVIIGQSCVQIDIEVPNDSLNNYESLCYLCTILIFKKTNAVRLVFTGPRSQCLSSTVTDEV